MRIFWRYISTFLRHWYAFLFLLAIDPFDVLERVFHVTYSPPHWMTWALLAVAIVLALLLTILDLRKLAKNNLIVWVVYDNLVRAFRELTLEQDDVKRSEIYAKIEFERGKLPDKGLDKIIRMFLDAEGQERHKYGLTPYDEPTQYILSVHNERMRNYIFNKYGERVWAQSTVNTANQTT